MTETFAIAPVESVGHQVGGGGVPLMLFHPAANRLAGIFTAALVAVSVNVAELYPEADAVIVTLFAEPGSVYVDDAIPLAFVAPDGVPNDPPAPPSLNVTFTPAAALLFSVASTLNAVGRVVPTLPLWPLPAFTERTCEFAVAIAVNVVGKYPAPAAVIVTVFALEGSVYALVTTPFVFEVPLVTENDPPAPPSL
jgi:hypothetical protein